MTTPDLGSLLTESLDKATDEVFGRLFDGLFTHLEDGTKDKTGEVIAQQEFEKGLCLLIVARRLALDSLGKLT